MFGTTWMGCSSIIRYGSARHISSIFCSFRFSSAVVSDLECTSEILLERSLHAG